MAQIIPFRGTCTTRRRSAPSATSWHPPMTSSMRAGQKALHDRHPQNIIRLELGIDHPGDDATHNRYTRAADTLQDLDHWRRTQAGRSTGHLLPYDRIRSPVC